MTGYKRINLGGVNIPAAGVTIAGIYDAIEESHKALLLDNVQINSVEYLPYFPTVSVSSSKFVLNVPNSADTVTIDSTDKVKYVAAT